LLLLDEFPRLGKIEGMTEVMATLRSKNVNICLIMQSLAQLDKIYGTLYRRIIMDNCQYQAVLRANDSETQKYLADLIGTQLHLRHSVGEHFGVNKIASGFSQQVNESRDWTVCPHELSTLEDILLLTPHGFYRVEKKLPPFTYKMEVCSGHAGISSLQTQSTRCCFLRRKTTTPRW